MERGIDMHHVYLLLSEKDRHWYLGYTEDPFRRIEDHNSGKNISTRHGRPWKLIYFEAYLDKRDALGRERFLKSGSGHRFLKKQLVHYFGIV